MNPYIYTKKNRSKCDGRVFDIYTFKNLFNDIVIVEVFHYSDNVYVIKFFLKKHRLSNNRYSLQYDSKLPNYYRKCTQNFIRCLDTIFNIGLDYLKSDNLASFGFMGAPRVKELSKLNDDKTVSNTNRYRVYKSYSLRYFSPQKFLFIDSESSSIFFIRNENNKNALPKNKVMKIIKSEIIPNL